MLIMNTPTDTRRDSVESTALFGYFAVFAGRDRVRGHSCIARARDKTHALKVARSNGIMLTRAAYAQPLSVQEYAAILRACGLKVSGVPEQLEMMSCAA